MDLAAYIEALEKARERKRSALSAEDLREIASELGWSDDDLAAIEGEVQAHVERARNFVAHEMWDEALVELQKASDLAPTRLGIWTDLANAHFGRFQATQDYEDLGFVEKYSNRCLELEPDHHASYALLAEVQKARKKAPKSNIKGRIAVGAMMLIFFGGVYFVTAQRDPAQEYYKGSVRYPDATKAPKKVAASPTTAAEVEVQFEADPNLGLSFVPKKIAQNDYDSGSFFVYSALLKNTGDQEFSKIKARLELVGEDGQNIAVATPTFLDTHQGKLRPGDMHALSSTIKSHPGVKLARFKIEQVDSVPAPPEYPPLVAVSPTWDIPKPPSVKLDVYERYLNVGNPKNTLGGLAFFKAEWELRNTGQQTLRNLKLEYRLIDTQDKVIDSQTVIVAYSGKPEISPGESRVLYGIKSLKVDNFARYEIHVIEAE